MAESILYLDLYDGGMLARITARSFSKAKESRECRVVYADLPEAEEDTGRFQQGLDVISGHLDLKSCTNAVVLVSSRSICFRNLSLPFKSPKKISQVLPLELASHLPRPDEAYVSDYLVHDVEFDADQHLVLSASMPATEVAEIVAGLKGVRINTSIITPKGYAAAVCHPKLPATDALLVHMDSREVTLVLEANARPVMVRTLDAETATPESISRDIRRTITGFRHRSGDDRGFALALSVPRDMAGAIQEAFPDEPVTVLDHTETVLLPERKPAVLFNFCIGEFGAHSFFRKYRTSLVATLLIALVPFSMAVADLMRDISVLEQRIAVERQAAVAVFRETFPLKKNVPVHVPLMLMQSYVKDALKNKAADGKPETDRKRFPAIEVLYALSDGFPADIEVDISRLLLNDGRLVITGSTDNFNNVDKLKGLIEKSPMFTRVDIIGAEAGKRNNRVNFKFNIDME